MEKAITYSQFIEMCEHYEHSKEYYDTMKEMAEIELMDRYLENQRFLGEEAVLYDFTEGVLFEAADENNKQAVKESFGTKAKNLAKKILAGIKKIFGIIIGFFTKAFKKSKEFIQKRFRSKKSKAAANIVNAAVTGKTPSNEAIVNFTGDDSIVSTDKTIPIDEIVAYFTKHWNELVKIDKDFESINIYDIEKKLFFNGADQLDENTINQIMTDIVNKVDNAGGIKISLDIDESKGILYKGKHCLITTDDLQNVIYQFVRFGDLDVRPLTKDPGFISMLEITLGEENEKIKVSQNDLEDRFAKEIENLENEKKPDVNYINYLQEHYTFLTKVVAIYMKGYNEILRVYTNIVQAYMLVAEDIVHYFES